MRDTHDPYDLERFLSAQAGIYERACSELRAGRKQSHWMWFIFPQIRGLGASPMARKFAIASLDEARAYLRHPILGVRLRECTQLVNAIVGRPIEAIFFSPDDLKFRSSMTLFAHAAADNEIFLQALSQYFDATFDPLTMEQIAELQ